MSQLESLLEAASTRRASDVHLHVGEPPRYRVLGELVPFPDQPALDASAVAAAVSEIASEPLRARLEADGEIDIGHADAGGRRWRVNVFRERKGPALALRLLGRTPPELDTLNVPRHVLRSIHGGGGLVLFVGHAGAGKTTTLAAVLSTLCSRRGVRVVTLEDPIEYRIEPQRAWLEQREVGRHCPTFAIGVADALEAAPDVLAIGELRDLETIRLALQAAETGVLVLATVHAYDATRAIGRLVDAFPTDDRLAARLGLAACLRTVVAQTLVRRADGKGRIAATEVVHATPATATLVRDGREHELATLIETGAGRGMQSLDRSLATLVRMGVVEAAEAIDRAVHREALEHLLGRRRA